MIYLKYIFAAMVIFDVVCIFITFGSDLCSTVYRKITKKKKTDTPDYEFEFDEPDEPFSIAPPLCVDSVRMVYSGNCRELVADRILPVEKDISAQLNEQDKESVILLLSSYINYLNREAPQHERTFTMVMELLKHSEPVYDMEDKDVVERVMEESAYKTAMMPDYYLDFQKYKYSCKNKEYIIRIAKVLILAVLRKLFGDTYASFDEGLRGMTVDELLELAKVEDIDMDEDADYDAFDPAWEVE